MAIKKRPPVSPAPIDPIQEARIDAFGDAAEQTVTPAPAARTPRKPVAKPADSTAKLKPMLMRFEADEHELLREVAALEGRSMHNMAKTALIPALEAIRAAHQR
jgi:hypothetical protein